MDDIFLTAQGLDSLKEELKELKEKKRPMLVNRVTQARNMGDLSENSEYLNAREELSLVDGRIEELEGILAKAKIIKKDQQKKGKRLVSLGCEVTVEVNGQVYIYNVVGEWEADPLNKKISPSSPLGKALLGKKAGDEVEVEVPAGKVVYKIIKIS